MFKYLGSALDDALFLRIVMGIWGLPFVVAFIYSAINYEDLCPDYWLFIIPVALGALGAFLIYSAIFADDKTMDKRLDLVDGSGFGVWVLIVMVVIVAIPIWELLKLWRSEYAV